MSENVTRTFPLTAGLAVRGQVRRELRSSAALWGLTLSLQEDKGFLESLFIVTVTGPQSVVEAYLVAIQQWVRQNS